MKCQEKNMTQQAGNNLRSAKRKPLKRGMYGLFLQLWFRVKLMNESVKEWRANWDAFCVKAGICKGCLKHSGSCRHGLIVLPTLILGTSLLFSPTGRAEELTREKSVQVILGESADQSLKAKTGVAEVIRRRRSYQPFSTLRRRNFRQFVLEQPKSAWLDALDAWEDSARSNVSKGATHFENIKKYGVPYWAKDMVITAKIDDLVFYREVKL